MMGFGSLSVVGEDLAKEVASEFTDQETEAQR